MKNASLALIGSIVWLAGIPALHAEKLARPAVERENAMPEDQRKAFAAHLAEASRLFQAKRIPATLDELALAEGIFKDAPEVHNLRGSCHVENRDFDQALEEFTKADRLLPGNAGIRFNIAEVHFVRHQWQEAAEAYEVLQPQLAAGDATLSRLVDLKLIICHCKLGAADKAADLAGKHLQEAATPFPWYAKAVLEFENSNRAAAAGFLVDVGRSHPDPKVTAPWKDTLIESSYVKN